MIPNGCCIHFGTDVRPWNGIRVWVSVCKLAITVVDNLRYISGARSDGVGVPIRSVDAVGARQVRGSPGAGVRERGRGVSQPQYIDVTP